MGCEKPDVLRPDLIRRTIYPNGGACDPLAESGPDTLNSRNFCPELHGKILPHVTIFFTCDPSSKFQLVGEMELTCMLNSRWSGQIPTCERRKFCTAPEKLPAQEIFYSNSPNFGGEKNFFEMGETLTFGCVENFVLVGKAEVECGPEGRWTHDFPACLDLASGIDGEASSVGPGLLGFFYLNGFIVGPDLVGLVSRRFSSRNRVLWFFFLSKWFYSIVDSE